MLVRGSFDASGSPIISIQVSGGGAGKTYNATIDTGFTGFVAMNVMEMIPLNLKTEGAAWVTLGDGTAVQDLIAPGAVTLGTRTAAGSILLNETATDVLIGLDFLRAFRLALIITATTVILYDENEALEGVFQAMAGTPVGTPNTASTFTSTGEV
jgi:predicted aspartyl protease